KTDNNINARITLFVLDDEKGKSRFFCNLSAIELTIILPKSVFSINYGREKQHIQNISEVFEKQMHMDIQETLDKQPRLSIQDIDSIVHPLCHEILVSWLVNTIGI
ncbi:hypothetical protein IJ556_01095, partial [bacterium]|nr:hypothetical protein [bacterium]